MVKILFFLCSLFIIFIWITQLSNITLLTKFMYTGVFSHFLDYYDKNNTNYHGGFILYTMTLIICLFYLFFIFYYNETQKDFFLKKSLIMIFSIYTFTLGTNIFLEKIFSMKGVKKHGVVRMYYNGNNRNILNILVKSKDSSKNKIKLYRNGKVQIKCKTIEKFDEIFEILLYYLENDFTHGTKITENKIQAIDNMNVRNFYKLFPRKN